MPSTRAQKDRANQLRRERRKNDPEWRAKDIRRQKERYKRKRNEPDFIERRKKQHQQQRKRYAEDPEYRAAFQARNRAYQNKIGREMVNKNARRNYNPEKKRKYYEKNKEAILSDRVVYRAKCKSDPDKYEEMKQKRALYERKRYKSDIMFKLAHLLRGRLAHVLKGKCKADHTHKLIGCTWLELKEHIEKQFKDGMNWENHGKGEGKWNIDHIIPFAAFDLTIEKNQYIVSWYKNLQPMWWRENCFEKRNKYSEEDKQDLIRRYCNSNSV